MKTAWSIPREAVMRLRTKSGALFLRCTEDEAKRIREAAKSERRTMSGFVLNTVLNRIAAREKLLAEAKTPPPQSRLY
jgi:uncharacterized protein (DUF1778 family)